MGSYEVWFAFSFSPSDYPNFSDDHQIDDDGWDDPWLEPHTDFSKHYVVNLENYSKIKYFDADKWFEQHHKDRLN